jgi:polysaccharide pyruvyl transferase WcaK-like protein
VADHSKRVALFGNFGTGNFGNDGSLEAMMLALHRAAPDEVLCCICNNTQAVRGSSGLEIIPINPGAQHAARGRKTTVARKIVNKSIMWLHAYRHLLSLKAIIVPGTGILDDFRIGPLGWPYDLFCWFVLARLMGVKVLLASIGAGPIRCRLSRFFLKSAARAAHYRSYRDETSKSYMRGIGLDTSADPVFPDLAFSLPTPSGAEPNRNPLTVGVGVMTYHGWTKNAEYCGSVYEVYIAKMQDYVRWLLAQGHRVRVLIGDDSDDHAAQDILKGLGGKSGDVPDGMVAYTPAYSLDQIMKQMEDIDVAVATRFHNVICALKMGKPTISIGYAPKNEVLLAEMGLADFCQHIDRLDVELLKSQTSRMISRRAELEPIIRMTCERYKSRLVEQEDRLASLICGRTR